MFFAKINKLQNHKILLFVFTSVWCMAEATASTMGSIMATVAVLEIHTRVSKHGGKIGISL
jgi:hypothetical protein